jgi:hypothetical protein
VLEEADRGGEVVAEPGEAAIVEVDDPESIAVDQEIGGTHVAMDETELVGRLAELIGLLAKQRRGPLENSRTIDL